MCFHLYIAKAIFLCCIGLVNKCSLQANHNEWYYSIFKEYQVVNLLVFKHKKEN